MVAVVTGTGLGLERSSGFVLGSKGTLGDAAVGRLGSNVTVNAATGNLVIQNQDEILIGQGPDSVLSRSYNSLGLLNDDNGDNWRESAQRSVVLASGALNAAGSTVRRTDWDGSDEIFTWDASRGAYVSKEGAGAYDTITFAANVFTWTDGTTQNRETYDYANGGRIISAADTDGNQLTYTYTGANLTRATTANGEYTELSWSGNNLTSLATYYTRVGNEATYSAQIYRMYDAALNRSAGPSDWINEMLGGMSYDQFAANVYNSAEYQARGVSSMSNDAYVDFLYSSVLRRTASAADHSGWVAALNNGMSRVSVLEAFSESPEHITVVNGNGRAAPAFGLTTRTSYSYDGSNRLTSVTTDLTPVGNYTGDGKTVVTSYTYDGTSKRIASISESGTGSLVSFGYVFDGTQYRIEGVTETDGVGNQRITAFGYNIPGRTTIVTDPLGKVTLLTYDPSGNLTSATYPPDGTGAAAQVVQYAYNANGDVTSVTDAMGKVTTYSYDGNGNLTQERDAAGDTVDRVYGAKNELLIETHYLLGDPDGAGSLTAGNAVIKRYAYDSENHLRFAVDEDGGVKEYRYNAPGQLVSTITYTGDLYNLAGLGTGSAISEASLSAWVASLGSTSAIQRTDTAYDFRGNIASTTDYSDLNVNRVRFSQFEQGMTGWFVGYNPNGIVNSGTPYAGTAYGKNFIRADFTATAAGQVASLCTNDSAWIKVTSGERLSIQTGVEGLGAIGSLVLAAHFIDINGNYVGGVTVGSLSGPQSFNTKISGFVTVPPGAANVRLEVYCNVSGAGTGSFNLIEPVIAQATPDQVAATPYSPGIVAYDTLWNMAGSASYSQTIYTYDQFGSLLSRQTVGKGYAEAYTYDGLGRNLTATDSTGALTTTAYNDAGRSSTITLANGMVKTSVFTAQGELWSYAESGAGVPTETEYYKYDKLGRLRVTGDATGYRDFTFYDDAGRKTGEMDRRGMLTEYRYDAANRLVATIRYATPINSAVINSLYDASGNPTSTTVAGARPATTSSDRWEWNVYDNADRVVQTITTIKGAGEGAQSGAITTYTYDGAGQLVQTGESSTVLAPSVVARLMANPPGALNRVYNSTFNGMDGWGLAYDPSAITNPGSPAVGVAYGVTYVKSVFTSTAANQVSSLSNLRRFSVTAGERLSVQSGVEALGTAGSVQLVVWWQDANGNDFSNTSVGSLGGNQGFNNKISGFVTVPTGAVAARLELYCYSSGAGTGSFNVIEPMVSSATTTQTTFPAFDATPVANAATDRIARSFYSNTGLLIGSLNGDGAFVRYVYDKAGRKIDTISYANLVSTGLRPSGSWTQIVNELNASPNASDHHAYIVYNGQGQVRYTLDGNWRPTEYAYNTAGQVIRTVDYGASIAAGGLTASYVQGQIAGLNLIANAATRISRNVYGPAGRLAYQIDAEGFVTHNFYNALSQIFRRTQFAIRYDAGGDPSVTAMVNWEAANLNAADRSTRYIYDSLARLAYEVDAGGYITEHQYDLDDRIIKDIRYPAQYTVTDSATVSSVTAQIGGLPAGAVVRTYAYDTSGNVIDSYDGQGNRTHYDYDAFNAAWQVIEAYGTSDAAITRFGFDTSGRVAYKFTAVDTPEQTGTAYVYDGVGNLTSISDPRGYATTYSYDAVGNRLTQTVPLDGSTNAVTSYQYDAFGNVVKQVDPRGNASYNYYDKLDRLVLSIDAEGYATQTSYTIGDEIAWTKRYYLRASNTGSVMTQPTLTGHALDATTSFARDKLGRITRVTDAEGKYEEYYVNGFGDRATVRNKLGGVTTNLFDARGLLIQETLPVGSTRSDGTVQATNIVNKYEYDARGNRTKMIEAYGLTEQRTTVYAYDKNDRLVSKTGDMLFVQEPYGLNLTYISPVETYAYDARGHLILTTDAAGAKTFAYYDRNDRKIAEISPVGTLSRWTYDPNGNVLTARIYGDTVALPASAGGTPPAPVNANNYRETSFAYDRNNRLNTTTVAGVTVGSFNGSIYQTQQQAIVTQNIYDSNGDIIQQIDGRGKSIFTWYDKLGRKIAQIDQENYLTTWQLDDEGNVTTETRFATRYSGTPAAGGTPPAVAADAANDRTTIFTYDRNGRRLTEQRTGLAYSSIAANGVKTDLTGGTATIGYLYNELGEVLRKTEANGDVTDYGYDALGRQTSSSAPGFTDFSGASVRPETDLYYNGINSVVRTRTGNGATSAVTDHISTNRYDTTGRLIESIDAQGFGTAYYYDAVGRLILKASSQYASDGHIISGGQRYGYDAAGRLIFSGQALLANGAWSFGGDTTNIAYNAYGEVRAKGMNGVWAEMIDYDAGGRIWRSTAGDGTVKLFIYDGSGQPSLTISSNGAALPAGYSWSTLTIDQAVALLTNNGTAAIGTVNVAGMALTINVYNGRGQLVETREPFRETTAIGSAQTTIVHDKAYNAFGEVASETDARGNVTNYTYNTMGRLNQKLSPTVNWTAENGAIAAARPEEDYYYDASGRMVGIRDANGNLKTRTLLAGSGYDGSDAKILKEFHPDGGMIENRYDVFGNQTTTINELGKVDSRAFDNMGRVTMLVHAQRPDGTVLVDTYGYDGLGQQISHTSSYALSGDEAARAAQIYRMYDAAFNRSPDSGGYATYMGQLFSGTTIQQLGDAFYAGAEYQARGVAAMSNDQFVEFLYTSVLRRASDPNGKASYVGSLNYGYMSRGQALAIFSESAEHVTVVSTISGRTPPWASQTETTDYDIEGRVTKTVDMGGDVTTYGYAWNPNAATSGLATVGGWTKTTVNSAGLSKWDITNYFGQMVDSQDYGGHNYDYSYDLAGRLTQRTDSAGQTITYSFYNTGLMASQVSSYGTTYYGSTITSNYKYDADGNRTFESYAANTTYTDWYYGGTYSFNTSHQSATVTWDAMNRMTSFVDTGASGSAPTNIAWEYDKVGNIRHMAATFRYMDAQGNVSTTDSTQDDWYKYDSMNRFVTTRGTFNGARGSGSITRGFAGTDITYDAAGERASASTTATNYYYSDWYSYQSYSEKRENYSYTADGYLAQVSTAYGTESYDPASIPTASGAGTLTASYARDGLGRVSTYTEYQANGTSVAYSRAAAYNAKSQVTQDITTSVRTDGTWVSSTNYYFDSNGNGTGAYQGGVVTKAVTSVTKNGAAQTGNSTTNTFEWWDAALQKTTNYVSGSTNNTSTFYYDEGGHLQSVYIQDGRPRTVSFITDANGQILQRDESDNQSGGDPRELHYYFNGIKVGDVSNNGTSDVDYATGIATHTSSGGTGAFRGGSTYSSAYADFDQSYDPINGLNYQSTATRYTVQAGDTLESIAQNVWGDSSFWYMIADANGLSGNAGLVAGRTLAIPNKVHNSHNTASTWKVYDPNEAIGDTAPTAAAPPAKKKGCGAFGQILLVAIAVAVVAVTQQYEVFAGLGSIGSAAASAALGSVVSQGVGVATGIQDKFSFKAVALAAIGGAVGGALKGFDAFKGLGGATNFANDVVRGALGSVVAQGIGVATGLQSKFDWAGVAAAGLGAGVGGAVGRGLKFDPNIRGVDLENSAKGFVSGMAGGIAASAAESLVTGRDFGDTLVANLPGIIGNTIGNAVAGQIRGGGSGSGGTIHIAGADQPLSVGPIDTSGLVSNVDLGPTGAGDGTSEQPQPGAGGGQVGGGAHSNTQSNSASSGFIDPTATVGGGSKPYPVTADLSSSTLLQLQAAESDFVSYAQGQGYTDYDGRLEAFHQLEATAALREAPGESLANADTNQLLFAGIGGPALLAGGAALAPAAGAYALSLGGTSVSGGGGALAYYGTSFTVGGLAGGTFEFSKNRVFGLQDTVGGYTGAVLGGGFGATGLQILGRGAPLVLNNMALGGVAGAGGDFVGQEVDMRLGNRPTLDGRSILVSGIIGGAAGGASSLVVHVNGLNAGSNSDLAIYRGLQTRIGSGNIRQFQLRYGVQGGAAQGILGVGQAGASSVYVGIYQDAHR